MCDVARTETEMETDGEREIQRGGGKGEMGLNCLVVSSNSLVVQFGGSRIGMVGGGGRTKTASSKMLGCRVG
jgi:hypothetical protein